MQALPFSQTIVNTVTYCTEFYIEVLHPGWKSAPFILQVKLASAWYDCWCCHCSTLRFWYSNYRALPWSRPAGVPLRLFAVSAPALRKLIACTFCSSMYHGVSRRWLYAVMVVLKDGVATVVPIESIYTEDKDDIKAKLTDYVRAICDGQTQEEK
eukprot:scaffold23340_cov186-Cylindrotheca_fusiformis.AAC.2